MLQNNCIRMRLLLIILILGSTCATTFCRQVDFFISNLSEEHFSNTIHLNISNNNTTIESNETFKPKYKRLKAALLALFLGHFGVHRIYLGTSANVPIVYSVTLGGGLGLLPITDFIFILTTKDLDAFSKNNKVFM